MTSSATLDRQTRFQGCFNFRDLGGLETIDGRIVRERRLFRSDAVHRLTPEDVESMNALHIQTLVDLRSSAEIGAEARGLLRDGGVQHLHVPLSEGVATDTRDYPDEPMEHLYARFLDGGGAGLARVFTALAQPATYPAIIHCAAGKDRTGITVALVLRTLGVPDDAIIADYAVTDDCMTEMIAAMRTNLGGARLDQVPAHYLRAMPETMQAFLNILDQQYRSTENYLNGIGVADEQLEAIRENLLVPRA
jgi:protein tyrosine/serine phosphatase